MNTVRGLVSFGFVCCVALLIGTWLSAESFAQTPDKASAFVGAWTLNKDLSEAPQSNGASNDNGSPNNGGGGGGGGRGGRGRGGFGGGGRNGGFGAGGGSADPDATARMRETIRDIRNPPDHLTIVATDTMVVLTGPDGRATRLSPDGTKIKDESTNIERKTKWDGEKLVSEMNGPGLGKTTETYTVDREHHQLHLLAQMEGGGGRPARKFSHVYDLDAR